MSCVCSGVWFSVAREGGDMKHEFSIGNRIEVVDANGREMNVTIVRDAEFGMITLAISDAATGFFDQLCVDKDKAELILEVLRDVLQNMVIHDI